MVKNSATALVSPVFISAIVCFPGDQTLPFSQTITEAIRGYDEKHLPGRVAVPIDAEAGLFFLQPVRPQFRKGGFSVVHLEETSGLAGVPAVFAKPDLDAVSPENR